MCEERQNISSVKALLIALSYFRLRLGLPEVGSIRLWLVGVFIPKKKLLIVVQYYNSILKA